ncbi:MAG: hypothetical protein KIG32_07520 [Ruminiclostridium sp.]|nr:hypothetical protein [Ruminiclostridium sp.]
MALKEGLTMDKKYIDADVLKRIIEKLEYQNSNKRLSIAGNEVLKYYMPKIIDDTPLADVQEVVHGRWKCCYVKDEFRYVFVCSECGFGTLVKENFCPRLRRKNGRKGR